MLSKHEFESRHGARFYLGHDFAQLTSERKDIWSNDFWRQLNKLSHPGGILNIYSGSRPEDDIEEPLITYFIGDDVECAKITRRSKLLCCMTSGPN